MSRTNDFDPAELTPLGELLERKRRANKLPLVRVAERSGIPEKTLRYYVRPDWKSWKGTRRLSRSMLDRLAIGFGLPLHQVEEAHRLTVGGPAPAEKGSTLHERQVVRAMRQMDESAQETVAAIVLRLEAAYRHRQAAAHGC